MKKIRGSSVFEGVVVGEAYLRTKKRACNATKEIAPEKVANEIKRFEGALAETKDEIRYLKNSLKGHIEEEELKILKVHLMILDDPVLLGEINNEIVNKNLSTEVAVDEVIGRYIQMFEGLDNPVYKQRAIDIKDISNKLLDHLCNENRDLRELDGKILVAKEVYPSELFKMHHLGIKLKGVVTEYNGATSHVAILAKSLEIPTLIGVAGIMEEENLEEVILDTRVEVSEIIINPDKKTMADYTKIQTDFLELQEEYAELKDLEAVTKDNKKIKLLANVGENLGFEINSEDGVGLLRSEFLYIDSDFFPSEAEQIEVYGEIYDLIKAKDKSMTIRSLDIGADKHLDYYEMPFESNPFLGQRGIRFTLNHPKIFKSQLRAVLQVAANREIKLMFPMVTTVAEIIKAKKLLAEAKDELKAEGKAYKDDLPIGIMVEVPATIFICDLLAKEVDFFSIGTNDLTQYILAVDRLSETVSEMYSNFDPSLIRAIDHISQTSKKHGVPLSVCGEMAGNKLGALALLSLGITDLSMLPTYIPQVKKIIRNISENDLEHIREKIIAFQNSEDIVKFLKGYLEKLN